MISFRAFGAVELTRHDGTELRAILAQPKRLALLTYLLLTPSPHFRRRDALTALFWPELDQEHARSALRQAIHFLEQALGDDILCRRGLDEIGFNSSAIWCDVREFENACDRGAFAEALELCRGELVEALSIADAAPELESWLDAERDRLRRRAYEAAALTADRYASRGDWTIAIGYARRARAVRREGRSPRTDHSGRARRSRRSSPHVRGVCPAPLEGVRCRSLDGKSGADRQCAQPG